MHVLVIDDDEFMRRAMARTLRPHLVHLCANAVRALESLADRAMTFDAILCDLCMDGMDGPTFFEKLRAIRPELLDRVTFVSGDADSPRMLTFLAKVRRPFVLKPFTVSELHEAVNAVAASAGAKIAG
jgi:CheY-like chemotaxis protein